MNNPIGRMPNPMAPVTPMGANPTAQNPSAMPLPVVNQPKVDMQMGNTADQRKKFNDLLESLSAPRQKSEDLPNVQGLHYGGMAGGFGMPMMPMMNPYMGMGMGMGIGGMGMNPYSMAYPSYSPGFGTTPTAPTTPTDTNQNPFGSTLTPRQEPVPTYGNMDSGTFPDASGNAMINNPSMGEPPVTDVVDPILNKEPGIPTTPMTPPSKYGVYGPDQLGAFIEDMLRKGNFNNPSVGQPITDMQDRIDLMNRFQDKQPPVIDPNSPENIEKRNSIMDYLISNEMVQKPQPIDLKDYGVMQPTVMNNVQPFQGLQGYAKGGGVGRMREAKLRRLDPLAENRLGTNEEAAARSRAIQSQVDKLIKGSYASGPDKRAQDDPKVAYDMAVKSTYDPNPLVEPGDPGYDKARGLQHGNFSLPGVYNSLLGYHDVFIPDFIKDSEGGSPFKTRMLQPESTFPPTTTDMNLLGVALDAAVPASALGREAAEAIKIGLDKTGIASVISDAISNLDLNKAGDYLGFANGGEVQYLRGGGPTNPISKTKIVPFVEKEKDYNLDKTIPNFFTKTLPNVVSSVKDFLDTPVVELFTGPGPGPEIKEIPQKSPLFSGPQGPAGLLPQANVDTTQQVNFDSPTKFGSRPSSFLTFDEQIDDLRYPKILNTYANIEDPSEILYSPFKQDQKSYIGPGYASPFSEEKPSYTIQPIDIIDVNKLGTDVLDMKAPMDVAPPLPPKRGGAGLNPNTLYDFDAFDIGTGTPKIADPFNIGSMGEFDTSPAGLDPFERARRERPPLSSLVEQAVKNVKSVDSTSGDSTSGDTGAATTDNVTTQQGGLLSGGIGSLLPLIVGMLNPTAGMALGIMQAMGGEGQGQGIFGNLFGGGQKEADPNIGPDFERIGRTGDQRNFIEKFLGLKAGTIGPGEAQSVGDIGLPDNVQKKIEKIAEPTVPDPILGEDGTYSCPLPYVYDPNTKLCVMMEAGLGGQGIAANQTKTPAGMQMGGQVNPSLNNAVDNFLQALA